MTQPTKISTTTLYRPVGIKEFKLIQDSGMTSFPPRLPEQPIFYPVLNYDYACQIAREWNTKDSFSGYAGIVLGFDVDSRYLEKFESQVVGGKQHSELWVPAEDLGEFNRHIVGGIRVLELFRGAACEIASDESLTLLPSVNAKTPPETVLWEGRHLRIKQRGRWEYVERKKALGVVAILAVTDDRKLVLVEQYRPALEKPVIEIPAGLAGDVEGSELEALAEAARRELLEETGYQAREMEWLTDGPSSAGLSSELITFFRARGLSKVATGGGDMSEKITVHEVALDALTGWIDYKRSKGCAVDYKVYAALHFHRHGPT